MWDCSDHLLVHMYTCTHVHVHVSTLYKFVGKLGRMSLQSPNPILISLLGLSLCDQLG